MAKILNKGGFILLPILAALALIGLFAYMLNRAGGLESRVTDSQSTTIKARYLAEAGMNHAKWFLSTDCAYRAALENIPFGAGHTYSVVLRSNDGTMAGTTADGTVHMVATGVFNGQSADTTTHFTESIVDDYRCVQQVPMAVYWSDWGDLLLRRGELDGSGITDLLTADNGLLIPKPLAVDLKNRSMYWGENNLIYRASVDGSFMTEVVDCLNCIVSGIDVDPINDVFYYTDQVNNRVRRAGLDGKSDISLISTGISQPSSLRVDLVQGRFYFSDEGNSEIKSDNLAGTDLKSVKTAVQVTALALDTTAKKIYYFDRNTRNIQRIDYNGGGLTTIVTLGGSTTINGLDLDLIGSRIYWARYDSRRLQSAKLDGTDLKDFVVSSWGSKSWGLRLGPAQPIVLPRSKGPYWTENQGNNKQVLRRAELDGTNIQTLVAGQKTATNIKFDPLTEQLFWAGDKKIMSSTVKGGKLTVVLDCNAATTCSSVWGLALDPVNQQVYFVDQAGKKINRVNYDGTNATTLVAGLNKPWDIDLDLAHGKMYWVDEGTQTLKSANLNGSGTQTLLSGTGGKVRQPYAIAVDATNSNLYWFDNNTNSIYRSTLTGGSVTPLVSTPIVTEVHALALDLVDGKFYWADKSLKKIGRSNLNGSAPETVVDLTSESNKPPWGVVIIPASL